MKVILLDNIRGVGMVGDIKDVSDGYARNFLLPRNLAKAATPGAAKQLEAIKAKKLAEIEIERTNARELADKLKDTKLEIKAKTNEQNTLFDGIEAKDLAKLIHEKTGIDIKPDQINLPEHIKHAGEHTINLELFPDITTTINLVITPE